MQQPTNTTNATETSPRTYAQVATGDQQVMSLEAKKQTLAGPKKKTRSRKQDMMKNKSLGDLEKMAERQRSKASFLKEQLAQQMQMAELLKNPDTAALGKQMVRDQKKIRQGAYLAHKTQLAQAEASDKANQERLEQEKEMQRKWLQTRQVERAASAGFVGGDPLYVHASDGGDKIGDACNGKAGC